ncbi:hypothetical protein KY339_00620 [Candidatus Woesearchaeota archaeon]|nr:hypothetical protein [Candidatus Woesearchaeota archaeon]
MDKTLVSQGYKVSIFDSFLNEKQHEIDLKGTYVTCFAEYNGGILLGTVSGDLILFDKRKLKTREVAKLGDAVSDMGFDGSHLYITTHNKTFYVFDRNLNLEKKIQLNLPEFSCVDIGREVLVGSYDGNVYRYADGDLETAIEASSVSNEDSVESIKQSENRLYVGLVKPKLRIYDENFEMTQELKFCAGIKKIVEIAGNLYVASGNNLHKMRDDRIINSRTLKKYRTTNFIRDLQHARIEDKDYLVFLYHDDIHFLDKNFETKFVKLMNSFETVWRIHSC